MHIYTYNNVCTRIYIHVYLYNIYITCIYVYNIYTYMKIAHWNPQKAIKKEGQWGKDSKKSNVNGVNLIKVHFMHACSKYHNKTPLHN
jgi:hypothetical protein